MRKDETYTAAKKAVQDLGKALNGGSKKEAVAGIVEGLVREHRYLQNEAVWTLLVALGVFGGKPEGRFVDDRNRSAYQACKTLRKALGDRIYWPDHERHDCP